MLMSPVPETDQISLEEVESIAKMWWLFAVMGVLSVIAGVIILEIDWTLKNLAVFVGIVFIVRGVFDVLTPPVDGGPRTYAWVSGVLNIALGVVILAWPEPTLRVIAALIGIWLLVSGIVLIVGAVANHDTLPCGASPSAPASCRRCSGIWALRRPGPDPDRDHRPRRHLGHRDGLARAGGRLRGEAPAQALREVAGRLPRVTGRGRPPWTRLHASSNGRTGGSPACVSVV